MNSVIIVAAGSGSRANLGYNKLLYKIKNKYLIEYTVEKFDGFEIILVVSKVDYEQFAKLFPNLKIVIGGDSRQQSVYNGVKAASYENVLIHDGARMFVSNETIMNVCNTLLEYNAVVPCVKVKDSIKKLDGSNVNRDEILIAQTPQGVKRSLYLDCYMNTSEEFSDDVSLMQSCGYEVKVVEGSNSNIKITLPEDLKYAEYLKENDYDL